MRNTTDYCLEQPVSYSQRFYDTSLLKFCTVPETGADAILFAAIGMVLTSVAPRKYYALLMLVAGVLMGILNTQLNMREFSNSIALWMGLSPAQTFFTLFLPPLLLDSAARIDYFLFKKVFGKVLVFAFVIVAANTVIIAAFMLYGLNLKDTWTWTDAFLFATLIASTDTVAVTAIMKEGGSPEELGTLIEGESLLNDATSIFFFNLFWPRFRESIEGELEDMSVGQIIGQMALSMPYLVIGGIALGLLCGVLTSATLKYLQSKKRHSPVVEVGVITGVSYLCYYVANGPARVSGVIAVVVYGLYGSATTLWDMSPQARESKIFESFWDVMSLLINGVIFLYSGVLATEYFWRSAEVLFQESHLQTVGMVFGWLPLIFVAVFVCRFLEIALFSPVLRLMGSNLKWSEIIFISMAGLRGAVTLILAQTLLQYKFPVREGIEVKEKVRAQLALWTCGFTMLTLLINGPMLPWLLRVTGLDRISDLRQELRENARESLLTYTAQLISRLKDKGDQTMRGVDWKLVESFAGLRNHEEEDNAKRKRRQGRDAGRARTRAILKKTRWNMLDVLMKPLLSDDLEDDTFDEEMGTSAEEKVRAMDRTWAKVGDHESELPFTDSMQYREALIESSRGQGSKGVNNQEGANVKNINVTLGRKTNIRRYAGQVVALSNTKQGNANEAQSTILIEQGFMGHALKVHLEGKFSGTSSTQPPQRKFTGLRKRQEPSLPDIWHSEENTALLAKRSIDTGAPLDTPTGMNDLSCLPDGAWGGLGCVDDPTSDSASSYAFTDELDETMEEARVRLLSGLNRHFHEKHTAGLISGQVLRILSTTCNRCMEHGHLPLSFWDAVQKEISGKSSLHLLSVLTYHLRKIGFGLRSWPAILRGPLLLVILPIADRLVWHLTCSMQLALEVSMEVWLGLLAYRNHSSLLDAKRSAALATEVQKQAELVWKFIIDREIEAPDRFHSIQTIRAAKAVLRQKKIHVEDLTARGLLEVAERDSIQEEILEKLRRVANHNLNLHPSGLADVVKTIPLFAGISREVFMKVIATCQLKVFEHGENVIKRDSMEVAGDNGIHIVISGLLRRSMTSLDGETHNFFIGRGGVLGLLSGLTGTRFPRMGQAYAELNALGHGPSILTIPGSTIQHIHFMARRGNQEYQQLELNMFQLAAVHVVEYMLDEMIEMHTAIFANETTNRYGDSEVARSDWELSQDSEQENSVAAAQKAIERVKFSLLGGKLVFLSASESYSQTSVFVLMHGTLRTEKPLPTTPDEYTDPHSLDADNGDMETIEFAAPCVFSWIMDSRALVEPFNFVAGSEGAMLVAAFTDRKSLVKQTTIPEESGTSIPPSSSRMHYPRELGQSFTSIKHFYSLGSV